MGNMVRLCDGAWYSDTNAVNSVTNYNNPASLACMFPVPSRSLATNSLPSKLSPGLFPLPLLQRLSQHSSRSYSWDIGLYPSPFVIALA